MTDQPDDAIWRAIDEGGGQSCDVDGVLRELSRAGYIIVSKQEYDDARWGRRRLENGGFLSPTNWPR